MAETTTQKTATAGGATATSTDAASKAGSNQSPPTDAVKVEDQQVEDKGNTAASDGQDGADSDGKVRQRPPRAERRISELTSKIKDLESELATRNNMSERLQQTPVTGVQLPDYSQMDQITPDQLRSDIINAASQIVDLKMQSASNVLEQKLNVQTAAEKAAREIERAEQKYPVLNPSSEDYDEDLVHDITESYSEIFAKDPTYSFTKFIAPLSRMLEVESNKPGVKTAEATESSSRGRQSNRPTAQTRSANDFPVNGTSAEMEAWFAQNRR